MADFAALLVGGGTLTVNNRDQHKLAATLAGEGQLIPYLLRNSTARQIVPYGSTTGYWASDAALPTTGLIAGDWAVIQNVDRQSQRFYGARWSGTSWATSYLYEQGTTASDEQAQNRVQINPPDRRYPTILGIHTAKNQPGKLQWGVSAGDSTTELAPAYNTGEGLAQIALTPGGGLPSAGIVFQDVDGVFEIGDGGFQGRARFNQRTTPPSNPPANKWDVYPKSDGLYYLNSAGVETGPLGTGGGGGGATLQPGRSWLGI